MVYLVDCIRKYVNRRGVVEVLTFKDPEQVISFVAENSVAYSTFEVVRINKYLDGKIYPYELSIEKGRIKLEPSTRPETVKFFDEDFE